MKNGFFSRFSRRERERESFVGMTRGDIGLERKMRPGCCCCGVARIEVLFNKARVGCRENFSIV